jgi:hypothetical protein
MLKIELDEGSHAQRRYHRILQPGEPPDKIDPLFDKRDLIEQKAVEAVFDIQRCVMIADEFQEIHQIISLGLQRIGLVGRSPMSCSVCFSRARWFSYRV